LSIVPTERGLKLTELETEARKSRAAKATALTTTTVLGWENISWRPRETPQRGSDIDLE
jgi:hypothetical protein